MRTVNVQNTYSKRTEYEQNTYRKRTVNVQNAYSKRTEYVLLKNDFYQI